MSVLDAAFKRDDGPAAGHHVAGHTHFAGIGEGRADKLGGGFVRLAGSPTESVVGAASAMTVSSIIMIQPP
ncbi:hypothetical protein SO078_25975 (plasmid) [Sinorhizobium meliloti]|uniref:hypothetical protein n=1 Tax=Rhizobium meliloti TaxID=382 RepID=UPI002D79B6F2|nr:hypothetical protein [Sinorhizobium meliloti]WRQ71594.1 hypothetical protein SO078_25975 [Sinorhizobium meliloti]